MSAHEPLPPTDALQQQPTPPLANLHFPDVLPAAPNIALSPHSTVWTKLYLLLNAHDLARRAARRVILLRLLLIVAALFAAIPLGILSGFGVYGLIYDNPERHAQRYNHEYGKPTKFYIRGEEATQQQYDYFLRTHDNGLLASTLAVPSSIFIGGLTVGIIWLLLRPRRPTVEITVEEQIAAITKDHPEAVALWGGVAVLRVPQLVEKLLDMQEKDARR